MIKTLFFVFLGGGMGSMGRFGISLWMKNYSVVLSGFPLHTLTANVVGALLIGFFSGILQKHNDSGIRSLLVTGFCGGFTTFSTFSLESLEFIKNGQWGIAAFYMIISFLLTILFVFLGFQLSRLLPD